MISSNRCCGQTNHIETKYDDVMSQSELKIISTNVELILKFLESWDSPSQTAKPIMTMAIREESAVGIRNLTLQNPESF